MNSGFEYLLYLHAINSLSELEDIHITLLMKNGSEIAGIITNRDVAQRELGDSIEAIKKEKGHEPQFAMLFIEAEALSSDPKYLSEIKREGEIRQPLYDDVILLSNVVVTGSDRISKTYEELTVKTSEVMSFMVKK